MKNAFTGGQSEHAAEKRERAPFARVLGWARLAVAVLVAAPLAMGVATALTQGSSPLLQGRVDSTLTAFAIGAMLGLVYGAPSTAIVGLPAHATLVLLRRKGPIPYILVGLVACSLNLLVISLTTGLETAQIFAIAPTALIAGPLAGAIFWLVRRPDQIAR
ncbi:MAG: hypothetical protein GC206_14390 [Alphaproteobacteria bacterium]|nr:hypothetical protein [Alphaproteobacteria bacterium]